jgi:hypothetical protein
LEVGRIRGWIKNPQDAANEFDISIEEAYAYWNTSFKVLPSTLSNLLPNNEKKVDETANKNIAENELALESEDANEVLYDKEVKECFKNGTLF